MPLTLEIPARELFDEQASRFFYTPRTTLVLEHSLVSISKWEAKHKKPYLYQPAMIPEAQVRSREEDLDYVRCMTIKGPVDPNVYLALNEQEKKQIHDYINDPMTATTLTNQKPQPRNREIVTSELIYYWMTALSIPFRPCETWHLGRLLKLIEVAAAKNEAPKKMDPKTALGRSHSVNAARRARYARRR